MLTAHVNLCSGVEVSRKSNVLTVKTKWADYILPVHPLRLYQHWYELMISDSNLRKSIREIAILATF